VLGRAGRNDPLAASPPPRPLSAWSAPRPWSNGHDRGRSKGAEAPLEIVASVTFPAGRGGSTTVRSRERRYPWRGGRASGLRLRPPVQSPQAATGSGDGRSFNGLTRTVTCTPTPQHGHDSQLGDVNFSGPRGGVNVVSSLRFRHVVIGRPPCVVYERRLAGATGSRHPRRCDPPRFMHVVVFLLDPPSAWSTVTSAGSYTPSPDKAASFAVPTE
jgi:hypothetical protein